MPLSPPELYTTLLSATCRSLDALYSAPQVYSVVRYTSIGLAASFKVVLFGPQEVKRESALSYSNPFILNYLSLPIWYLLSLYLLTTAKVYVQRRIFTESCICFLLSWMMNTKSIYRAHDASPVWCHADNVIWYARFSIRFQPSVRLPRVNHCLSDRVGCLHGTVEIVGRKLSSAILFAGLRVDRGVGTFMSGRNDLTASPTLIFSTRCLTQLA